MERAKTFKFQLPLRSERDLGNAHSVQCIAMRLVDTLEPRELEDLLAAVCLHMGDGSRRFEQIARERLERKARVRAHLEAQGLGSLMGEEAEPLEAR